MDYLLVLYLLYLNISHQIKGDIEDSSLKKIITYGTFDLFHFGHLEILRRAKELGDYLIVAISTDTFNDLKGKKCIYPFEHRRDIVSSIKYVDKVIPEENWEQKRIDIQTNKVEIFVMGDDWHGKFAYCRYIY